MKEQERQILSLTQDLSDCLEYDIEDSSVVDTYDTDCKLVNKGWVKPSENSDAEILQLKEELKQARKETVEKTISEIKQSLNSVETIVGDTHKLQPEIGYSMREVDDLLDKLVKISVK